MMSKSNGVFRFFRNKPVMLVTVVLVAGVIGIGAGRFVLFEAGDDPTANALTFAVKRGPLRISVTESGTIKAREQVILRSEVEGRTSILWLIPEGTLVKQGDLLVELDATLLVDTKIDQEIKVQNDEALFIGARENLAVVKNQAKSNVDLALLTFDFAKLDLNKFLEGEFPTLRTEAEAKITLAEEELQRAKDKLKWSNKLYEEKYISNTELQADTLARNRADLDVKLAKNNLDLLLNYTYQRDLAQRRSDVNQAEMALERTEREAKANIAQAEADLKAKESEFNRQKDKLKKTEEQIEKAKIYAPADGPAIYATSARRGSWRRSREPLDVGQEVTQREELIYLPTSSSAKAEVDIHETSLKKVEVGLPAIITVDALPGKTFVGSLVRIAPLPDAQSMWMNPDLKVYNAEIYLDSNDTTLRTGMSCKAEIVVEQYEDATFIPVQTVLRVGGETTAYVVKDKTIEPRSVQIGLDNNRMVRIIGGLQEGELVLLTPPLKSAAVGLSQEETADESAASENATEAIYESINNKLENRANGQQQKPGGDRPPGSGRDRTGPGQRRKKGRQSENMSAEEREKMRERFQKMSPEDRDRMKRRRQGGKR